MQEISLVILTLQLQALRSVMGSQEAERHSSQLAAMKQQTREHKATTLMTAMEQVVRELLNEH